MDIKIYMAYRVKWHEPFPDYIKESRAYYARSWPWKPIQTDIEFWHQDLQLKLYNKKYKLFEGLTLNASTL